MGDVVAVLLLLGPTVARADIPSVEIRASRAQDGRVQIDRTVSYYIPELMVSCATRVGRWRLDTAEGSEPEVWLDGSAMDHDDCACYLRFDATEPVADATGQECTWQGTSSMNGTCPSPFFCHCDFICEPIFDAPCDGEFRYSGGTSDYAARITVEWRRTCAKPESPFVEGCGCRATRGAKGSGPWPHVIVVLLFGLAALGPMIWHRRRAARRPRSTSDRLRP